jgi:Protein of unknown function (DUF565)
MQRTRLNTLFNQITLRFRQWVFNPWRRLSILVMSLLFGNFAATAAAATSGQTSTLDVMVAASLVLAVELISWLYYRFTPQQQRERINRSTASSAGLAEGSLAIAPLGGLDSGPVRSRSTLIESLNAFKLGLTYGLFVEAFKLGS